MIYELLENLDPEKDEDNQTFLRRGCDLFEGLNPSEKRESIEILQSHPTIILVLYLYTEEEKDLFLCLEVEQKDTFLISIFEVSVSSSDSLKKRVRRIRTIDVFEENSPKRILKRFAHHWKRLEKNR